MTPYEAARKILEEHWDKTLPVNPVAIANSMGVKVFFSSGLDVSGKFVEHSGQPAIYVNPDESLSRKRFTIFHELGHNVMGHGARARDKYRVYNKYNFIPEECDANNFAAEMLMPRDAVEFYANEKGYSLSQLANVFAVSEKAMAIRLERLGI